MARFRTKRVYDQRSTEDGTRILIMRFWPRGVGKSQVDEWARDVAPSRDLLFEFKRGGLPWDEYVRRYRAELRPEALAALRSRRGVVTLLCSCRDEARCHRTVLLEDLLGQPRSPSSTGSAPAMEPRISRLTLGVRDLSASRRFYVDGLGWPVSSASSDEMVFLKTQGAAVALCARTLLAQDATVSARGSGFRGFALVHQVRTRDEVLRILELAQSAGGSIVKAPQDTFQEGHCGYFSDPDGYLWEVAWNPHLPINLLGEIELP